MLNRLIIIFAISFSLFNGYAQRPEWEKVPISFVRLPSNPVSPMANQYQMNVVLGSSYSNNNGNDYNAYYPQPRFPQVIADALQLNGCQQVLNSPQFKLQVTVEGFYPMDQQLRSANVRSPSGATQFRYFFDVFYIFKISYQVFDGNGNLIRNELVSGSASPKTMQTTSFVNQQELEIWWSYPMNRNSVYLSCDNAGYQQAMTTAVQQLNSELGFTVISDKVEVANMKKPEYADIQSAFSNASMGYSYLITDTSSAYSYLKQAIQGWEGALPEYDPTNNNSRITEHVAVGLYVNLALAYCYVQNFAKANFYTTKLSALQNHEYQGKIEETIFIIRDYERRVKANSIH